LHTVNHAERVLAFPHDHDPSHRIAHPVELGDAATDVGTERDLTDIADADGHAVLAARQYDVADVRCRLGVAAATHHVFGAGHLDETSTDVVVSRTDGIQHFRNRQVKRP